VVKESGTGATWRSLFNLGSLTDHDDDDIFGTLMGGFAQSGRSSRAGSSTGFDENETDANGSQVSSCVPFDRVALSVLSSSFAAEKSSVAAS